MIWMLLYKQKIPYLYYQKTKSVTSLNFYLSVVQKVCVSCALFVPHRLYIILTCLCTKEKQKFQNLENIRKRNFKKISLKYKLIKIPLELKSLMKIYVFKIFMGQKTAVKHVSAWLWTLILFCYCCSYWWKMQYLILSPL